MDASALLNALVRFAADLHAQVARSPWLAHLDAPTSLNLLFLAILSFLLGILVLFGLYHFVTALAGAGWARARRVTRRLAPAPDLPRVTFLVTAYQEGEQVVDCVRSVLAQRYPADKLRVVVVADHDTKGTAAALAAWMRTDPATREDRNAEGDEILVSPRVTAVLQAGERAGQGKPRALQNGTRYVPSDGLVGILDADHLMDADFLERAVPHFADPEVGIVQGRRIPKVAPRSWLGRWDMLEQNVGQIQSLLARDRIGAAAFYGSTGVLRAELLHRVGWEDCLAEDTLMHYDVRAAGYRTAYEPRSGSREDHVGSLRSYIPQRRRWAGGHMQVLYSKIPPPPGPSRWVASLERILHLNYYNLTLVLLTYWLVRAAYHWVQAPSPLLPILGGGSLLAGALAALGEWRLGPRRGRPVAGFLAAALVVLSVGSLAVSWIQPAPATPPFPLALELALFLSPAFLNLAGYLNPLVRRPAPWWDHTLNVLVLLAASVPMLLVNVYVTISGLLGALVRPRDSWIKTIRNPERRIPG